MTDDDEAATAQRLAQEFRRLVQRVPPPVFEFSAGVLDAYTLVALLQLVSRHPSMSDEQRHLAVQIARGVALTITEAAREAFGPDSAIERTLEQGFDPGQDVPEEGDFDDLDDGVEPLDIVPAAVPAHDEWRSRYVVPTWIRRPDEEDAELSKCAVCARFFVARVAVRLFTSGDGPVLGFEVCDGCAPAVLGARSITRG